MKLHLSAAAGRNVFTAYGPGYVAVNEQRHVRSLIVTPHRIVADWPATTFAALQPEHLAALVDLDVEIVLLGTGEAAHFPRADIIRPLVEARIGVEAMDVQAACRTYNILMAEERKVAAALLLG